MRSGGECLLSSHGDIDVREMAGQLEEMGEANDKEFATEYLVKVRKERVGDNERRMLKEETKIFCKEEGIIRTEDKAVGQDVFEGLAAGKVVTIDSDKLPNQEEKCWLKVLISTQSASI